MYCVFCAAGVDFTSSVFFIILEPGHTTVCTNGTLFEDSLVEGTESFFLVMTSNNPDIILNDNSGINSIQTQIFIEDNTGICTTPTCTYFTIINLYTFYGTGIYLHILS